MIFDTHAHYDDEQFNEDRVELLNSMEEQGVGTIINVSATYNSCRKVIALAKEYPFVYAAVGIHPDEVGSLNEETFAQMKELFKEEKVVAAVKKVGTLNLVLILVGAFFVWFNWQMILVFREYGSMPETYACAVVAATIGECGICGWIRTNKDKRLDRKWQKEDEKESQEQYVSDINVGNKNEEENL